ncbi:MAG: O-antigen ligase family protein, partial [Patescibacteria group bacterium]|nr:O-antigen ligase family protein [Patescibacteria group bacterium]
YLDYVAVLLEFFMFIAGYFFIFLLLSLTCGIVLLLKIGEDSLFDRKWKDNLIITIKNRIDFLRWDVNSMRAFYIIIGILLIISGIIITFSRVAWLGALILLVFAFIKWIIIKRHKFPIFNKIFFDNNKQKKESSISHEQKLLLRDTFFLGSLYVIIILVFLSPLIVNRICINECDYGNDSFEIRKEYLGIATNMVKDNPVWGVGAGNFVLTMNDYTEKVLQKWEMQPVHSFYFLIITEIGVIGLIILVYFVFYNIKYMPFKRLFGLLFLVYLLLGFFDHFFASIFQGQLLFWTCLAFFASSCNIEKKDLKFDNF